MTNGTKTLIGLVLAGTAGLVIFFFVHMSSDPNGGPIKLGTSKAVACTKGTSACLPEVNYTDTQGHAYTPASLAGKVVVVNFWATWCHPCQKEIPDLSKAYDKYKDKGVVFLGIMTDDADSQKLLNFQSDYEMTYPIVRSNSDIMVSYEYPQSLPTTFVYDRGGKQVFSKVGGIREDQLAALLEPLVSQE